MSDYKCNNLPNFFILGAAKAGTTSLCGMLKQHPEIFMTRQKETQFFFNDKKYARGLDFYIDNYFSDAQGYSTRGEGSPSYFHAPDVVAPRLIGALNSRNLKFVVILRDPVERAWSHYLHRVRVNAEECSFADALQSEEVRLARDPLQWAGYYRDGLYGRLVSRWLDYFERTQFLFLRYEDLTSDWLRSLRAVCLHLGVDPEIEWAKKIVTNQAGVPRSRLFMRILQRPRPYMRLLKPVLGEDRIARVRTKLNRLNTRVRPKPILDANEERRLRALYTPDITLLEQLLEQDFHSWKLLPENDATNTSVE
jgi:hypothetical protein